MITGWPSSSVPVVTRSGGASGFRSPRKRLWSPASSRRRTARSSSISSTGTSYYRRRSGASKARRAAAMYSRAASSASGPAADRFTAAIRDRTSSARSHPARRDVAPSAGRSSMGLQSGGLGTVRRSRMTRSGGKAQSGGNPTTVPASVAPRGGQHPAPLQPQLKVVLDGVADGAMALEG